MKQIKWMGTYVIKLCKVTFNLLPKANQSDALQKRKIRL